MPGVRQSHFCDSSNTKIIPSGELAFIVSR
jgi:hypothetical protein